MPDRIATRRNPWAWIPSLYYAQGFPNALIGGVSLIVYKNLGLSNTSAAAYTSWLYLPWVIKPFWSPVVESLGTRRGWIWSLQFLGGAALAGVALTIPTAHFLQFTLALFWFIAFASATHDIAADGFYIQANTEREQSAFSGVRNASFNLAKITAQGLLVALAGELMQKTGGFASAWAITFALAAAIFLALGAYHSFILPRPAADLAGGAAPAEGVLHDFPAAFGDFFRKPKILTLLAFLLLYRFAEAQLVKMAPAFLIDPRARGGLGLSNADEGLSRLRHRRRARLDLRRVARRIRHLAAGAQILALADGPGHAPSGRGFRVFVLRAAGEFPDRQRLRRPGAIRLRFRFCRLHDVPDLHRQRKTSDRALRDLHRVHGAGIDAPSNVERPAGGQPRLSTLFLMGAAGHDSGLCGDGAGSAGAGIWEEGGIENAPTKSDQFIS